MKPLKLTMQAFGSYGKRTQISLKQPGQNLFLITGDTGAGKTTIFDAIVFALYGEASSVVNKKDGAELQSQFASLDLQPFVELVFSEGGGIDETVYTVRRVPRHIRPLKRGSGVKEESETVSLTLPDGTEYPQKEADRKLEEIVGLNKHQFMQVAMIAQGEFMELLRAKSDDKKKIFRKLFHTELYDRIADELGRRKKEQEKEIDRIKTMCQTETAHIRIPENDIRSEALQALKERILSSEKLSVSDMEQLLEALGMLCGQLKEAQDAAREAYETAGSKRDQMRDAYKETEHLLKFFGQMDAAQQELIECREAEAGIKEQERLLAGITDAYEVLAEYEKYEEANQQTTALKEDLSREQTAAPVLEEAAKEAAAKAAETKRLYAQELERFSRIAEKTEQALDLFEKLKQAKRQAERMQSAYRQVKCESEKNRNEIRLLEEKEEDLRRQKDALSDTKARLALWKARSGEAEGLKEEAAALGRQKEVIENLRKAADAVQRKYRFASEAYQEKNAEYETMRQALLDAQAGFLAKELLPGKACPVCGSTSHPAPCQETAAQAGVSREAADALQKEADELRDLQEKSAAEAKSKRDLLAEKEAGLSDAMQKFCTRMKNSIEDMQTEWSLEQAADRIQRFSLQISAEGERLMREDEKSEQVRSDLQKTAEKKQELCAAAEKIKEREEAAFALWKKSQANLESLETSKEYATEEEADFARNSAKRAKEEKEKQLLAAEKEADAAKRKKEHSEALTKRYLQEFPKWQEKTRLCKQNYEEIRNRKAFREEEWKQITAEHKRTETQMLQESIDAYKHKQASAQNRYDAAKEAVGNKQRPDAEAAREEMQQAQERWKAAEETLKRCQSEYQINENAYQTLAPIMQERGKIVEVHAKLDMLYRLVSGNVPGSRMDLETYVQRHYLEHILYAANIRFRDMSAGQFELRMYELEKAGEGKNRGLDLMVYSAVTGKEREIRTLSGGESFMAALSLALGMADQIQQTSAAIHLDMMFIDEGFGSLDEHSRHQAIRVLQEMAGGSRLIGIISHVSELKQEIEDQLIVRKDADGSHVKWKTG
ncbi:MAG: AAA family ATPase [Eubacterium sp.]|nr:AAA family ATPase [Eubacterium sp.]